MILSKIQTDSVAEMASGGEVEPAVNLEKVQSDIGKFNIPSFFSKTPCSQSKQKSFGTLSTLNLPSLPPKSLPSSPCTAKLLSLLANLPALLLKTPNPLLSPVPRALSSDDLVPSS